MSRYAFLEGSTFKGDADEVQAELERIRRTGDLTPEAVVAVAKPKRSVLHAYIFDGTSPDEALEKYHLSRARRLIRSIIVIRDSHPTTIRANVRIVTEAGRAWESVELPDARAAEVERLNRELRSIKERLRDLEMYPNVVLAISEVLELEAA